MSYLKQVDAGEITEDAYTEYAKWVNGSRALPEITDGLKIVQRRILAALVQNGGAMQGDLIACPSVIGDCIKLFHPHGDQPVYGAIVTMVNDANSLLKGHGGFGYNGLESTEAAAFRYVKVGLSDYAREKFLPLYRFAETYINENEFSEPRYIPTAVPQCLLSGAYGIGVGCSTYIPQITPESIAEIVKAILLEEENIPYAIPHSASGGHLEISKAEIKNLNETGCCHGTLQATITEMEAEGRTAYLITNVPKEIDLSRLKTVFNQEIDQRLISIVDKSKGSPKILVQRVKRVKRLKDSEIVNKLNRVLSKSVSYRCMVSVGGKAKLVTPIEMIETAVSHAVLAYKRMLRDQKSKVSKDIIFQKVKKPLAEMLLARKSKAQILKALSKYGMTDDMYDDFVRKAISTLRSEPKDVEALNSQLATIVKKLKTPKASFGKDFKWIG